MLRLRKIVLYLICAAALVGGGGYVVLKAMMGLAPWQSACFTDARGVMRNVSGFDFDIMETDCDGMGNDASVSVFAGKAGETRMTWYLTEEKRRTLLFQYEPSNYPDSLPTIKVDENHKITIFIPAISSIKLQNYQWQYGMIEYDIGHIDYPDIETKKPEPIPLSPHPQRGSTPERAD